MEMIREVLWTECGEFIKWLRICHLLNDSDPCSQLLSQLTVNYAFHPNPFRVFILAPGQTLWMKNCDNE